MIRRTLLMDESPLQVQPTLAVALGLNEAIFFQQLHYWLKMPNAKQIDGQSWAYNTLAQWSAQFPFWSQTTLRRAILSLRKSGLVLTANHNETGYDRTLWYTINYERYAVMIDHLDELLAARACCQNEQIDLSKMLKSICPEWTNRFVQDDHMYNEHEITKRLPENTQETTCCGDPRFSATCNLSAAPEQATQEFLLPPDDVPVSPSPQRKKTAQQTLAILPDAETVNLQIGGAAASVPAGVESLSTPPTHAEYMAAYASWLGYAIPDGKRTGRAAKNAVTKNLSIPDLAACYAAKKAEYHYKAKHLPLDVVITDFAAWIQAGRPSAANRPVPPRSGPDSRPGGHAAHRPMLPSELLDPARQPVPADWEHAYRPPAPQTDEERMAGLRRMYGGTYEPGLPPVLTPEMLQQYDPRNTPGWHGTQFKVLDDLAASIAERTAVRIAAEKAVEQAANAEGRG